MFLQVAFLEWLEGDLTDDDSLRAVVRETSREDIAKQMDWRLLFAHASKNAPGSTSLFRLLRDLTTCREAQGEALASGFLEKTLNFLNADAVEKEAGAAAAALMFVSNCIAGDFAQEEARTLVWENFDYPKFAAHHAPASGFILYSLCDGATNAAATKKVRQERLKKVVEEYAAQWVPALLQHCGKEHCAYWVLMSAANAHFSHSIFAKQYAREVIAAIDCEEPKFPLAFVLHVLPTHLETSPNKGEDDELLVKLAMWTCEFPIEDVSQAQSLLIYCASKLDVARSETTQCLQIIANVVTRGDASLQDFIRELGAIKSILLLTRVINPNYPTLREWALFAFKACCENNAETQAYVHGLQTQTLPKPV